ncbi:MAG TPA: radical SAM protein [Verrucomicrobiae bacterium]|nr:radical SAM protein [Verrucomicrobiae bacterium]
MANLMITTGCNFRCPYCFGLDLFGAGQLRQHMSIKLFREIMAWIDRAAVTEMDIHLMGGEPTLHPAFGDMVEELVSRGRKTVVFSNAAAPLDDLLIRRTAELGVSWIVNCNPPATYRDNQLELLRRHLGLLRRAAAITFNFTDGQTPYQHVFDYIEQYDLKRAIKLGVALPTLEHRNASAEWDNLPSIALHILELIRQARRREITVEFECGVPYCLFSEEQHGELRDGAVSHCGSRLDITPTGEVINCLPLFRVAAVPFHRFQNYRQAREWFQRMLAPYRQVGSASRCLLCQYRLEGRCSACLAYGLGEYSRIPLPPLPSREPDESAGPGLAADRELIT